MKQPLSAGELLDYLRERLPALMASGKSFQIEIHGKGSSVQVKESEFVQFSLQPKPLEERR